MNGLQRDFNKHSGSVFQNMKARVRPQELPFNLRSFRLWLLEDAFSGSWDNAATCAYCNGFVNALTFVVDHRIPVKFGGPLSLPNLCVCCKECNVLKGAMSEDGFRLLTRWATENLHQQDMADMFGRMKNGAGYMRLKIQARKRYGAAR